MAMTFSYQRLGLVKRIQANWTSDAAGAASGTTDAVLLGELMRAVTDPVDGPTDNYDVTLSDEFGANLLQYGLTRLGGPVDNLGDLDTADTEDVPCTISDEKADTDARGRIESYVPIAGKLTVTVANAGNAKSGIVHLFLRGDILG